MDPIRALLRTPAFVLSTVAVGQPNSERDALSARLRSIDSELSEASRAITAAEGEVNGLDSSIGGLAARLATVRGKGYAALGHLDKTTDLLSKKWTEVGPSVKTTLANVVQPLSSQLRTLQGEAQTLRVEIDTGNWGAAQGLAGRLAGDASALKSRVVQETGQATAPVREIATASAAIDRDLKVAETTLDLFAQAAFPMKASESPVLAIEAKLMEGEKCHGTLYFTNQRFVFEGQKEVVLEKKLFIVTKKRIDRTVMIERPVGAVQQIAKGRVGLIAGIGVYVHFRPEIGLPVTPFDVKGWEADIITRFFTYITGGEAERDIAATKGVAAPAAAAIKLVRCPSCGAPPTGDVYQGQTSIRCEYCGSTVAVAS